MVKFKIFRNLGFRRYCSTCKTVSYVQGQSPEANIREYFYYIDHRGMLFLDDTKFKNFTCSYKDKKFLKFFFKNLRWNKTNRYFPEFPFLSLCGRERNFVRCDDYPIVFNKVTKSESGMDMLCYNNSHKLLQLPFEPNKVWMCLENGRVYHPAPKRVGSIGLVQSALAAEFNMRFTFKESDLENPTNATHFLWNDVKVELDTKWFDQAVAFNKSVISGSGTIGICQNRTYSYYFTCS